MQFIPEHESVSYADEMHDTGYDPTNEMHIILHRETTTGSSSSGQNAIGNISLDKFEQMLDKKFEPLHTNMSILEEKFSSMHMDAQSNFASMRADFKNELQHMYGKVGAIEDRVGIQEANIDNVMTTISKLDAAYQNH